MRADRTMITLDVKDTGLNYLVVHLNYTKRFYTTMPIHVSIMYCFVVMFCCSPIVA